MVFFTCVLIVIIFYFLQTDGLIYVTIVAVVGEMLNLFLTQTAIKAVKKKTTLKFVNVIRKYKTKIKAQRKTIEELQRMQEESVLKVMAANKKIKEYEERLKVPESEQTKAMEISSTQPKSADAKKDLKTNDKNDTQAFDDLPSGSNRKKLPF